MSCNSQKISALRRQIPSFECVPGCHDCCGPVTTSPEEMSRLPRKTAAEQEAAMDALFDSIGRVLAIRGGGGVIL